MWTLYLRTVYFRTTYPGGSLKFVWLGTMAPIRTLRDIQRSFRPPFDRLVRGVEDSLGLCRLLDRGFAPFLCQTRTRTNRAWAIRWGRWNMPKSKELIHLRFQAVVIASQLPDNKAEAMLVLDYARHMVLEFLDDSSEVSDSASGTIMRDKFTLQ